MASFLRTRKALLCCLTAGSLSTFQTVDAAPAPPTAPTVSASGADAVGRFIADKGLTGTAQVSAAPFVDRVRDKASDMVATAMNFLGVPYRRGGQSDTGFDCSGFTRQVFENSIGLVLPRRADEQAKAPGLVAIVRDQLQPGDLVFFNTLRRTFSHVGIYVGDGKFIHAPRPGGEVRVEDMRFVYWAKRFTGARRAEPVAEAPPVDGSLAGQAPVAATAAVPAVH